MSAEEKVRYWIARCANCDVCRTFLDGCCQMFPELYLLWDEEQETGKKITTQDVRRLIDLCNLCGICPCEEVPTALMEAKSEFAGMYGLPLRIRAMERVELIGRMGCSVPGVSNFVLRNPVTRRLLQTALGIHRSRRFASFPKQSLSDWLNRQTRPLNRQDNGSRKAAYFAGCSARYYVPEVGKAVVDILQHNGIEVHVPEQKCCGMPPLLEGDKDLALELAEFNLDRLAEVVEEGYDVICSCPTCGFALKHLLKQGAYYSTEYWAAKDSSDSDRNNPPATPLELRTVQRMQLLGQYSHTHIIQRLNMGYFSSLNGRKRLSVAENTYDLGEYLRNLHRAGELNVRFGSVPARSAYYPPCHLREQEIGTPYSELLSLIPDLHVESIDGPFYCCGTAGIVGFKSEFHESSIKMAEKLVERIRSLSPEKLLTDCLGCRYQFNHLTPYEVSHPIEIMKQAYDNYR